MTDRRKVLASFVAAEVSVPNSLRSIKEGVCQRSVQLGGHAFSVWVPLESGSAEHASFSEGQQGMQQVRFPKARCLVPILGVRLG